MKVEKSEGYSPKNKRMRAKAVTKNYLTAELQMMINQYNSGVDGVKPQDKLNAIKLLIDLHGMKEASGTDLKDLKVTLKI